MANQGWKKVGKNHYHHPQHGHLTYSTDKDDKDVINWAHTEKHNSKKGWATSGSDSKKDFHKMWKKVGIREDDENFGPGVTDLVANALEQKPVDFQSDFNSLLKDKISAAVAQRKLDLASTIATEEPEDEGEAEEEPEDSDGEYEYDYEKDETDDGEEPA